MAFPHLFRNVPVQEVLKKRSDAVLKHYESASDARAWSHDKVEKAEHIQDILKRKGILTCEEPSDARGQLTATLDANDNVEGMSKDQLEQIKKLQRELKVRSMTFGFMSVPPIFLPIHRSEMLSSTRSTNCSNKRRRSWMK